MTTDQQEMKPPAFACAAENGHQTGMTLRDYFAGEALAALIQEVSKPVMAQALADEAERCGVAECEPIIAAQAYKFADAMLATRKEAADV